MTKLKNLWRNFVRMLDAPLDAAPVPQPKTPMDISSSLLGMASYRPEPVLHKVQKPELPPGVRASDWASDQTYMATDSAITFAVDYAAQHYGDVGFPGYPYLAQLNLISEYRSPSETTAMEMTRKWIKIVSHGDGDKSGKVEDIEAAMKRLNVRAAFEKCALLDGQFGHAQLYIKIKGQQDDDKRMLPLIVSSATIKKGDLEGFVVIEPLWTTPYAYNSNDPTAPDFYKPREWFVLGKRTHASRLLSFISRPVPDMLKPAYNFGGLSMTQLMEPYVRAWQRTRDSVSELIHAFSITGILTEMGDTLQGGTGDGLFNRMDLFNKTRDNRGLMVLNKDTEEMFQFNAPLSGLDKLQAQAQEHMAAPSHTPLVKLLGISPTGLNPSAEGELDVYDDYIAAMQENLFRVPLKTVINIIQLSEFGEIDESIDFEFVPMKQLDGEDLAAVRKSDAEAAATYIAAGVLDPLEERTRLAADPHSGYTNIDVGKLPEPPADPDAKPEDGMNDGNE